jgi:hypothetical protein
MNWLHTFWFSYEKPSLIGNGPEDLTALIIVTVVSSIFVPRIRRWWVAREQEVHAKLDHNAKLLMHVIKHHPDIPNEDHNGVSLIKPLEESK